MDTVVITIPDTRAILADLIAFPTVSRSGNRALVDHVRALVEPAGARVDLTDDGDSANMWITTGPDDAPGVVLSGHSDVVPVAGQAWSRDPFVLHGEDGRLYGRGTADMKGFLASAIRAVLIAARRPLKTPLHLAISFDEEIGCVGVRSLLPLLAARPTRPLLVWIGEPTGLALATGHKGKAAYRVTATGRAAHSALTPQGLNAIHLAADFVAALRAEQDVLIARTVPDPAYDVGYSTIHVGTIRGGEALNIVPRTCTLEFEIRNLAGDDPAAIEAAIRARAEAIVAPWRDRFGEAAIVIEPVNTYPGLDTRHPGALALARAVSGHNAAAIKLAFGTEGGLFAQTLGVPAVICGPGSMDQGHKPDEFVTGNQLARCDAMLARLIDRLEAGLGSALPMQG
jgi:acetylornithine deacetylase